MYVARLDRPWLETPFLFQGFPITSSEDIDKLKQYCEYVYVDQSLSETSPDTKERYEAMLLTGEARPGLWLRFLSWLQRIVDKRKHASLSRDKSPGLLVRFFGWLLQSVGGAALMAARADGRVDVPGSAYKDQVSLVDEIGNARQTYDRAQSIIQELTSGIRTGGRLELDVVETVVTPMVDSVLRNNDALAWLARLRSKDDYSYGHSIATSVYTIVLGRHIGYNRQELHQLGLGGLLLDVGKTKLPRELLVKKEKLTDAEMAQVRSHVGLGLDILEKTPDIDPVVLEMVKTHHERRNGTGYPHGLKGDEIPMFGQIGGLCDSFDAMTSVRPYADTLSAYEAMRKLLAIAGSDFQSELVEQFIQCIGMFPTGSLVELSSGEVGIVISQNKLRRLRPVVMVVLDAKKKPLQKFRRVDLRAESDDSGELSLWIRWGLEPGAYGIDPSDYYL
jgi:HD-GYP domain-containing protein (c-di-GMP phosphodiesterase class II)